MRAQFHGLFHKKTAPHGLAEGQSHDSQGCGPGRKRFTQAFQVGAFFAHRADSKATRAALPVQQTHLVARHKAQHLSQMLGFLPFQADFPPPGFGRQIKKRSAHATITSFITLASVPRRALRTALKPSCSETRRP